MNSQAHILVDDDDPEAREELREYLTAKDYRVSTAEGGGAMRAVHDRDAVDLILLDLMMPGEHVLSLLSELRHSSEVGVILLTGTGDDFVSKPCDLRQLLARVRTTLRRVPGRAAAPSSDEPRFGFERWPLDLSKRQLTSPEGADVELTTAEFDLLAGLAQRANRVLSRDQLMDLVHDREWSPLDRSIDNRIRRLRRKIEADPRKPKLIKTVRGGGYTFTAKASRT